MYKLISAILITLITSTSVFAQQEGVRFHSINSGGLIISAKENSVLIQTVNGLAYKTFFIGLGVGLDYYRYNTIPLFADVRKTFGKKNSAFVYGDLGINFSHKNKPGGEFGYFIAGEFRNGLYNDIGLGYKATLIKKSLMVFTMGYSYKSLKRHAGLSYCTDCQQDVYEYNLGFHRIFFKAGIEL